MASPQANGSHYDALRARPILPDDIIAQVCQQIFATPLHQYDLSLMRGHNGQWSTELRFRCSLPLVSRSWWKPATRGLYKHIVIRRLQQIPGLARTLRSMEGGINFGALVRKITLYQCVVMFPGWDVEPRPLQTVFRRCVFLEELSFICHPSCEDGLTDRDNDLWWERMGGPGTNPFWVLPKIVFPALQARAPKTTLRKLDLASFDGRDSDPDMWDLPRLRSLTVVAAELPILALQNLGRSLTYVHLSSDTPCTGAGFAQLSRLCPALEHLAFYPSPEAICALYDSAAPLRKLRHLDVWLRGGANAQAWTPSDTACLLERFRSRIAPALESARGLLAATPLPRDLPTICHPSMLTQGADGTRFACVRDVWMVQTAWCVQRLGDWWLDEGMWLGPDPDPDGVVSEGDMSNLGEESESEGWTSDSEADSGSDSDDNQDAEVGGS
ncbi:hypothetical protein GSI_05850 [Ganoderma sinense ZZ0214-1]|uniref:Uncharacterized protein n=1 Tax=Ganoderma sinense ZZ0214-1 TaxID=1077348 RepID=A0A2G8SBN8_9APHY|nr:hypothetical protein GSI_05850 [Ganoderma sinense ZZ0214-1]